MKTTLQINLALLLISTALFLGCSNMMDSNPSNQFVENFLTISPTDNSQEIGINEPIILQFAAPVDANIVEENFVIINQNSISDIEYIDGKKMDHSDMNSMMSDGSMLAHLKENHCIKGSFEWNSEKTKCEFMPDSGFEADTDYMVFMDSQVMNHMKSIMSERRMMSSGMGLMNCDCHKNGPGNSNIITHFRTRGN
ncbi:MAG: hypothetical protein M9949_10865 [Candidatus Kapabacteria bacterium]|nr:hypothetical protein [Candidatus Kapabacteria bacterium]